LERFIGHPETDCLELDHVCNHLRNTWRTDQLEAVTPFLQQLLSKLREMEGDVVLELEQPTLAKPATFEHVFRGAEYVSVAWYKRGLDAARSVARIEQDAGGAIATGFVVRGSDLRRDWGEEFVLLTNSYIITDDPSIRERFAFSIPDVESIRVRFMGGDPASAEMLHRVKSILFSSPPTELDVSISLLEPPVTGIEPLRIATRFPSLASQPRTYVMGHPGGGALMMSLQDGRLIDYDESRLHYTASSESGSSGSPVFNKAWELIGIHHAGHVTIPRLHGQPGIYSANEGIWIQAIIRHLNSV
jgi:Trypsin-like peptidase domain